MITASFRAMDTDVDLAAAEPCDRTVAASAFDGVEALFLEYDRTLTRFSEESELSALNRAAGRPFVASPLLFNAVANALSAADESGGIFDPTILDALLDAGYDRTFAIVSLTEPAEVARPASPTVGAYRRVVLDPQSRTIVLPAGVHLDLGGIAKGMAVDAAVEILRPLGNFFVNAGGDLYVAGEAEDGPWPVGVQDPFHPERDIVVLEASGAGIATSSIMRRRWRVADGGNKIERHHLIDPRTGRSAETDLAAVTVVAGETATADVLAKVALILGSDRGGSYVERQGAAFLMVTLDGRIRASADFPLAEAG